MPWAVTGSLKCPASPASAQPGPGERRKYDVVSRRAADLGRRARQPSSRSASPGTRATVRSLLGVALGLERRRRASTGGISRTSSEAVVARERGAELAALAPLRGDRAPLRRARPRGRRSSSARPFALERVAGDRRRPRARPASGGRRRRRPAARAARARRRRRRRSARRRRARRSTTQRLDASPLAHLGPGLARGRHERRVEARAGARTARSRSRRPACSRPRTVMPAPRHRRLGQPRRAERRDALERAEPRRARPRRRRTAGGSRACPTGSARGRARRRAARPARARSPSAEPAQRAPTTTASTCSARRVTPVVERVRLALLVELEVGRLRGLELRRVVELVHLHAARPSSRTPRAAR